MTIHNHSTPDPESRILGYVQISAGSVGVVLTAIGIPASI